MTEKEMQGFNALFDSDENNPIYYVWDERSGDKRLLCASHDIVTVCKFILNSPILTEGEKVEARAMLSVHVALVKEQGVPPIEWMN
jgi:hypothetical protein